MSLHCGNVTAGNMSGPCALYPARHRTKSASALREIVRVQLKQKERVVFYLCKYYFEHSCSLQQAEAVVKKTLQALFYVLILILLNCTSNV